ncbi:MAG TPA: amidohydrolase, partial [Nevskiaceae bacterium]|nr:amidohydrolase [Nevskiaceae bacterium]
TQLLPTLQRVVGAGLVEARPVLGAEDFSFFAERIPGLYLSLGIRTPGEPLEAWPANHSPRFRLDEAALPLGVRVLSQLAVDFNQHPAGDR